MSKFPIFSTTITAFDMEKVYKIIMENEKYFEYISYMDEDYENPVEVKMSCDTMDTLYSQLRMMFPNDCDIFVDGSPLFTEDEVEENFGQTELNDEFDQRFFGYNPG